MQAVKQPDAQKTLECLYLITDRAGRHPQLPGGKEKASMPPRRLKGADGVQRGQLSSHGLASLSHNPRNFACEECRNPPKLAVTAGRPRPNSHPCRSTIASHPIFCRNG